MKKRSLSMVLLAVLLTLLTVVPVFAGGAKTASVKKVKPSIRLDQSLVTLEVGKSVKLTAKVRGKSKKVVWYSNDNRVASVKNGKVTGKKEGYAVVMAKANGKTAKCLVMVEKGQAKVKDLYDYTTFSGKTTFAQLRKEMPWLKFSIEDRSSDEDDEDERYVGAAYKLTDGDLVFESNEFAGDPEYGENDLDKIECVFVELLNYKEGYSVKGIYPGMALEQVKKIMSNEGYIFCGQYNSEVIFRRKDKGLGEIWCILDKKSKVVKSVRNL